MAKSFKNNMPTNNFIDTVINDVRELIKKPAALANVERYLYQLVNTELTHKVPFYDDLEVCLFEDDNVSIWYCRFQPGIKVPPHDHQMNVVVGVFDGVEHHGFYQANGDKLTALQFKSLNAGEVLVLNGHEIHDVTPDSNNMSQSLHVYFGPLNKIKRTVWDTKNTKALPFTIKNYEALAE